MSKWDGLNRRKFPRVRYPCLVIIQDDGKENKDVILTHTENVGVGGVCVILKKNLKMFTTVELELDLLDLGEHVKCQGKVVWNVRRKIDAGKKPLYYDIGIEFGDLNKKSHEQLETAVKRLVKNHKEVPYT